MDEITGNLDSSFLSALGPTGGPMLRTTCVTPLLTTWHAINALPQRCVRQLSGRAVAEIVCLT